MRHLLILIAVSAALGCNSGRGGGGGGGGADAGPAGDAGPVTPDSGPRVAMPPGSACNCDADCLGDAEHPAICVFGVCMTRAAGACSAGGSTAECPAGSRCWGLMEFDGDLCWPDCASSSCAGECDADGSCVPTDATTCDPSCGGACGDGPCSASNPTGICEGADQACIDGACVAACSPSNPAGFCPGGSVCTDGTCVGESGCPSWMCTGASCAEIVSMPGATDPRSAEALMDGYYVGSPRYRYLRRDLTMLIQFAACEVAHRFPGTDPIALLDLSQADGLTPGTDTGRLRHPDTTHRGDDMDLAYYVTDGSNDGDIICGDGTDTNGNGTAGRWNDGYFCTTDTNIVDWPRQAYWFAMLATTPLVRVFGIDETLPDDFRRELDALLAMGAITREQHDRALSLGYGNEGGWAFHHHHSHMSYSRPR